MKTPHRYCHAFALRLGVLMIAAFAITTLAAPAWAQSRAQRIGIVDVDQILQRSVSFQAAAKRIERELAPLRERLNSKTNERDGLRQGLRDRRSVLKPEEVSQQEEKYFALSDEVSDVNYSIDKESGRLQREILEPIMKRLKAVIEDVAKSQGYDLVLYANQAAYFSEAINLTPVVLQTLDREAGSAAPSVSGASAKSSRSSDSEDKPAPSSKKSSKSRKKSE